MNLATWKSIKSPVMQEIREALKYKGEKGKPTPSKKEANRVWREEILGFLSEDQKKQVKAQRQEKSKNKRARFEQDDED